MKSPFLFIGYDPYLFEEIKDFLNERHGEVIFASNTEETIKIMNTRHFETVFLNFQRIEDAAILRYINMNFQETHVLLMPGTNLKEAIPAITGGRFDILEWPFKLEALKKFI